MADGVVVLASDWVGYQIVSYLTRPPNTLVALGLHSDDRDGYNDRMRALAGDARILMNGEMDAIIGMAPEIGVLAWWPELIRGPLLHATRWLNIHPSLLPHNRGKNPNFWSIRDGTPCGVTLHWANDGVDTGPVLAQRELECGWEQTGGTLYLRSREVAVRLFTEHWEAIRSGTLQATPQAAGTTHRGGEMEAASHLDLDEPTTARAVLNTIRARMFPPYPRATFTDGGKNYSVTVNIVEAEA